MSQIIFLLSITNVRILQKNDRKQELVEEKIPVKHNTTGITPDSKPSVNLKHRLILHRVSLYFILF